MNATRFIANMTARRFLLVSGVALATLALLILWAARRETPAEKQIRQKLAELRADGEPVDGTALAKMFAPPPKALDAGLLLSNALEFASHNTPPGLTPIIMSGPEIARTEKMEEQTVAALRHYWEDTAPITTLMPKLSDGARFGNHWEHGVADAPIAAPFQKVRALTYLLSARALYAAEVGDAEGASEMLERSFRFARAIPSDSTLVEHMVREACLGLAVKMTERCLNRVPFDDRQLARVLEAMPPPDTNGFVNTLRVEHCLAIWAFNEVKSGRRLEEIMSGGNKNEPWWKRFGKRLLPRRGEYSDEDFVTYLEMIPPSLRMAEMPPREGLTECARILTSYQSSVKSGVALAVPASWTRALERHHELEARLAALKVALAVERFRAVHHELPARIELLTPDLLPEIPRDAFDNRPLRFKLLTKGYVVYSIGVDGADDGGLDKTNPANGRNYDVTVTVER